MCVVGDPDQSIYAWRGADIRNILDFEQDYPDSLVVRLEQNYRSSRRILDIASKLIERNTQRKKKTLWTENEEGAKARVLVCADERDEAQQVMDQLRQLHEKGVNWSDMAIFYRINAMSRVMEDALFKQRIPYEVARGVEFYGRKEIKDVLAYLRVIVNPDDEVSLERVINTPTRGIGDNSIRLMQAYSVANGQPLFQVMKQATQVGGLSKKAAAAASNLATLFARWRQVAGIEQGPELATSIQAVIETVVKESGLEEHYRKETDDDIEGGPLDNIYELITAAAEFDEENPQANLEAYLHQVSLVSDADHRGKEGAITLMTLHAAKGLEFPVVAIIGMEEGILPHERVKDDAAQMEEERRLCFVGVTRAQQYLLLSRAQDRMFRGMRNRQVTSPFLKEMPADQLEVINSPTLGGGGGWPGAGSDEEPAEMAEPKIRRGQMVRHPSFGIGTVTDVSGMGANTRLVVDFQRAGRKTLILEFARLSLLGD
jgi:DNA helicase-2/ATP-dependent DNA helicase PcrA